MFSQQICYLNLIYIETAKWVEKKEEILKIKTDQGQIVVKYDDDDN